ncbi:hypothetical protein Ocin01_13724 [Orchesella cincta]|uniref:Uncharacterized protein n=1 Tax=Orchesella cincta TaxID=48709 RepID=A0A1D2MIW9_ORCCI|nr:hypothetical protein Ocin01_13724 [Orchesella cincta]
MEGYQKRQSEDATLRTESFQSEHNDTEQEPHQMETNNPEGETVTVNVNPEACSISVALKREHGMNDEEDLESDDEVQQVSKLQKRRTLCEGVEYWERIRRPGNERYLQCSLCSHRVPIYEKCKRGELTPYKTLAVHMQAEHKAECKKKGNNKRPGTSSKRARTKGDARADSESDPQPSTSRNQLNRNGVEVENGNANGDAPEHYVLKARKRKVTFLSVEILKYIGTRNPDNKYLECKRCHEIFPVNPRHKNGEKKAYEKIKKHIIEKKHRDKRKKITSAALAGRAFQSEQTRVKVENPLNSGTMEGDDEGETVGMPPVPVHPYTQPSAVDGDEMPGVGDILPPEDAINVSMMMQTPSPAPYSPFYKVVYRSV